MNTKDVIKVEIAEYVGGYFRVVIDDLPIAQFDDRSRAEELVIHFEQLNSDKKIVHEY